MTRRETALFAATAASAALIALTTGLVIRAQEDKVATPRPTARTPDERSVQDALHRPFDFNFSKPTPLDEVARGLSKSLGSTVVLDRAALDRQGLHETDEVRLDLRGARLKTGLKLLLDQLDLTYRVEAEDNLLVITDSTGAKDPVEHILAEIKALHHDFHELQDALDDLRADLGLDDEGGPKVRKPTMIEEVPGDGKEKTKPKDAPPPHSPAKPRSGY